MLLRLTFNGYSVIQTEESYLKFQILVKGTQVQDWENLANILFPCQKFPSIYFE